MINVDKQTKYWIKSAESDLESAKLLIDNNKYLNGLFFCHLVLEKAIKSHVVKEIHQIPPKSHNLLFLLEKTKLVIDENMGIFLGILMKYQLQGRYPDYDPNVPAKSKVYEYFYQTEELLKWIKNQL